MAFEQIFVSLMATANHEKLKHLVDNNNSLVQYAKGHPSYSKINSIACWILPFINLDSIQVDKVMYFLKTERPDLHIIVNRNWVSAQLGELKREYNS